MHEIEFIFEPQEEGGYHVYAPELPGRHTQGDTLEEATESAREALELYVEGLREDGAPWRWASFDASCRCQRERAAAGRLRPAADRCT